MENYISNNFAVGVDTSTKVDEQFNKLIELLDEIVPSIHKEEVANEIDILVDLIDQNIEDERSSGYHEGYQDCKLDELNPHPEEEN